MSYLLDTNVVCELTRPRPNRTVVQWLESVPTDALHISVITHGEIRKGVELLTDKVRKEKLRIWMETELPAWFESRLLPISLAVADRWGRLLAEAGRSVSAVDSLLAATALHHELRLVTRNEQDFRFTGLEVINPWKL